jgi:hypothetical protein
MNDFNIEFAHIYSDQDFGTEQAKSVTRLKKVIKELKRDGKSFVTVVLIDEYSPAVSTLDEKTFLEEMKKKGVSPDFVAYESNLCDLAENIIGLILKDKVVTHKFRDKEVLILLKDGRKIGLKDSSGKYSCSLLISAWILARFGVYKVQSLKNISTKEFSSDNLITILPKKYKETEKKVLDILAETKHKDLIDKIKYEFF